MLISENVCFLQINQRPIFKPILNLCKFLIFYVCYTRIINQMIRLKSLLMSALYFASTKGGYVKRFIEEKPANASGRQIPVHARVNEYMHNKPKQQDRNVINEVEEETEHYQHQYSAKPFDITISKGINNALVKSAHLMQKRQQSSINDEGVSSSLIKQRQYSSKDTSASHIDHNNTHKIKFSIIQSEIGKNQDNYDIFDRKQLEKKIQQQKVLRKNLENSYLNLVQKMLDNKKSQKTNNYQGQNLTEHYTIRKKKSKFHPKIQEHSQIKKTFLKTHKKERNQSQSSQSIKPENIQIDKEMYDIYQQHLNLQKNFQSNLIQEIRKAHARIDALQNLIVRRQIQFQKMLEEKVTLNPNLNNLHYQRHNSSQSNQAKQILRHQFHYIFTIFVMFLIIVILSKNREK